MAAPVEHKPLAGYPSELEEDLSAGALPTTLRLGFAATVICLVVVAAGALLHNPSTKAAYAPSTRVEVEVQMAEDEAQMAELRSLAPAGYCQIYAVPVNFWKKYTEYKKREVPFETSKMRQYFAEWGSEDGKRPHVTITRDRRFSGEGDHKAACRSAAQKAMTNFWRTRDDAQEGRFRLDSSKLRCSYSQKQQANKLNFETGGRHELLDALEEFLRETWDALKETPLPLHATHISCEGAPSYKALLAERDWRAVANFKLSGGNRSWLFLGNAGRL